MARSKSKYVSASEIAEYAYCGRAWWLRRHGERSANLSVMNKGTIAHDELARRVVWLRRLQRVGVALLVSGVVLLALLLLARALGG